MKADLDIKLYLIRHGETNRNLQSDLIGQSPEEPLNDNGRAQALKLTKRFQTENIIPDIVYTSPYNRAQETCEIVCGHLPETIPVFTETELREINQGDGINKSRKELYTKEFKEHLDYMGMGFKFNNGEALYEVEHRAVKWLNNCMTDCHVRNVSFPKNKPLNIFVFTHGMTVKCLLHHIMKFDHTLTWKVNIDNTSVSTLHFVHGNWFIEAINDCWHLKS